MMKKSKDNNINPKVDKRELKKLAKQVNITEEQAVLKKFVIIVLILIVLIVGIYFFTRAFVTKDLKDNKTNETTEVTFDYSKIILGTLLNRPYDEYYVIAYNSEDLQVNYYANMISMYSSKEDAKKIYVADLNDSLNEKFYNKSETNPSAKKVEDLKLGDLTLIKIKDKNIVKYVEGTQNIKSELGI